MRNHSLMVIMANLFAHVITVCNLLALLLCSSLLLLQACQQHSRFDEGLLKHNQAAVYNTQLGLAYLKQGDRPRAKRKLLRALELDPNSAKVNAGMAYYFERAGELKEAHRFYKKALSFKPKDGSQLNNYGSFLCRLGKYKEAERYFLQAVQDVHYLHTSAAYENAGLCVAAIPDYPRAERYFIKALTEDPQRRQSLYELVKIAMKQNHSKKALAYLKQYSKLSLNDPALLALAAEASHRTSDAKVEEEFKLRIKNRGNNE